MPFPVLAGIPWLAGVIAGLFTALFTWLIKFFSKRVAVVVAIVGVIATVTAAFFAGINALLAGIVMAAPDWVGVAASMVVPSNTTACLTAIVSAYVLKWAYAWNVRIIQYKLF